MLELLPGLWRRQPPSKACSPESIAARAVAHCARPQKFLTTTRPRTPSASWMISGRTSSSSESCEDGAGAGEDHSV